MRSRRICLACIHSGAQRARISVAWEGEGTIPDQDVALLLDHDEVHAAARVLAHECVRHEVEEHIREEAAGLG